jgi:hypothetical protein
MVQSPSIPSSRLDCRNGHLDIERPTLLNEFSIPSGRLRKSGLSSECWLRRPRLAPCFSDELAAI